MLECFGLLQDLQGTSAGEWPRQPGEGFGCGGKGAAQGKGQGAAKQNAVGSPEELLRLCTQRLLRNQVAVIPTAISVQQTGNYSQ